MRCLLALLVMTSVTLSLPANAGDADTTPLREAEPDLLTREARERYDEGMRASAAGNHEKARVAYLQTYALRKDSAVLRNLAVAEIQSGHTLSGARRLARYLRGEPAPTESGEQRAFSDALLRKAERELGRLEIVVDAEGAQIRVDAELVGEAPLGFAWHVDPGIRVVSVAKHGMERTVSVDARAGTVARVELSLVKREPAAGAPRTVPLAVTPPPEEPPLKERVHWPAHVSTAVAGAGLVTGTLFAILAASTRGDIDAAANGLSPTGCGADTPNAAQCGQLRDLLPRYDREVLTFRASFITAGAAAAIATIFFISPPRWGAEPRGTAVHVSPAGVHVAGHF